MNAETDELEELRALLFPKNDSDRVDPAAAISALFQTKTTEENES